MEVPLQPDSGASRASTSWGEGMTWVLLPSVARPGSSVGTRCCARRARWVRSAAAQVARSASVEKRLVGTASWRMALSRGKVGTRFGDPSAEIGMKRRRTWSS